MSRLLSSNYKGEKYGLTYRLVNEDDAELIVNLRTDNKVHNFLHQTSKSIEQQRIWIKEYKLREHQGKEFYFIYEKDGIPFGVNRIYNIHDDEGTTGSWICLPGTNPIKVLTTCIILYDVFFDIIMLKRALFETHIDNVSALKVNKALGGKIIYEKDSDLFFELLSDDYHSVRENLKRIWRIK